MRQADEATLGAPGDAPFGRILVSAEARTLPEVLVHQLGADGVLALPVAGEMTRVRRDRDGVLVTRHDRYRYVPLIEP